MYPRITGFIKHQFKLQKIKLELKKEIKLREDRKEVKVKKNPGWFSFIKIW